MTDTPICECGDAINGKRYRGPNHAEGCPAHVRETFTVLEHDGARVVMEPAEAAQMLAESPGMYTESTVMLTRDQFERMDEFTGF